MTIRTAIVGYGEIAKSQHEPTITSDPRFELSAIVSRRGAGAGAPTFPTIEALLTSDVAFEAVALCAPPEPRFAQAMAAIAAGKHVLLEKPPGATLAEVEILADAARERGVTLFASWHSRFAAATAAARAELRDRTILSARIVWREDVRKWHPGQDWIWRPGGMGVFDPGVNALSIATDLWPTPLRVAEAVLETPSNAQTPIKADLTLVDGSGVRIACAFDWRGEDDAPFDETWMIEIETNRGRLTLADGGATLLLDGAQVSTPDESEYAGVYARFADLIGGGGSDVDIAPFRLVADAMTIGRRIAARPFDG